MRNHKLLLFFFLIMMTSLAKAYDAKDGNITASVGPFIYKTNFPDTPGGARSPYLADWGILVGGDISDKAALEVGLLHMHKLYFRTEGSESIVEQSQVIHVSMGYRRWVNPYLSGLIGFYSAYPMDEPKVVHNEFTPATQIETSARDLTEYGFDFSVQSELWHDSFLSVIADARYSLSMTSKAHEKADHYGVMLAIRYLVQEREPRDKGLQPSK